MEINFCSARFQSSGASLSGTVGPEPKLGIGGNTHFPFSYLNHVEIANLLSKFNNPTERALRGPVVGRRNHFGSKSSRGTRAAAVLYTLVESAKVCGVDPIAYLIEVVTRARRNAGAVLMPGDYAAERVASAAA